MFSSQFHTWIALCSGVHLRSINAVWQARYIHGLSLWNHNSPCFLTGGTGLDLRGCNPLTSEWDHGNVYSWGEPECSGSLDPAHSLVKICWKPMWWIVVLGWLWEVLYTEREMESGRERERERDCLSCYGKCSVTIEHRCILPTLTLSLSARPSMCVSMCLCVSLSLPPNSLHGRLSGPQRLPPSSGYPCFKCTRKYNLSS